MSLRRLWAIAVKEWIHIRRDPRSLVVALALPLILLLLIGAGINLDLTELPFALCDLDGSASSRALREKLINTELLHLVGTVPSAEAGEALLRRGEALAVLVIPPGMGRNLAQGETVQLQLLLDGSDSNSATIARGYLDGLLASYSLDIREEQSRRQGLAAMPGRPPIAVARRVLYNPALESRQFIVPGLIVVILVILGALLTSGTIVRERERGSFEQLAASPARGLEIVVGKALPYVGLGLADILLAMLAGALVFGVHMRGSSLLFLACGSVFMMCALGLGLLFSSIARTQQLAMVMAFVATLLPATLLSGFGFPIRNMPEVLQAIAQVVPATHFLVIARGIYLKGVGVEVFWPSLLVLMVLATVLVGGSLAAFRKRL